MIRYTEKYFNEDWRLLEKVLESKKISSSKYEFIKWNENPRKEGTLYLQPNFDLRIRNEKTCIDRWEFFYVKSYIKKVFGFFGFKSYKKEKRLTFFFSYNALHFLYWKLTKPNYFEETFGDINSDTDFLVIKDRISQEINFHSKRKTYFKLYSENESNFIHAEDITLKKLEDKWLIARKERGQIRKIAEIEFYQDAIMFFVLRVLIDDVDTYLK